MSTNGSASRPTPPRPRAAPSTIVAIITVATPTRYDQGAQEGVAPVRSTAAYVAARSSVAATTTPTARVRVVMRSPVEGSEAVAVALGHRAASDLERRRQLAALGHELVLEQRPSPHLLRTREPRVHAVHRVLQPRAHLGVLQRGLVRHRQPALPQPPLDHRAGGDEERRDEALPLAVEQRLRDPRVLRQRRLDRQWCDLLPVREGDQLLLPPRDAEAPVGVKASRDSAGRRW